MGQGVGGGGAIFGAAPYENSAGSHANDYDIKLREIAKF